MFLITSLLIVSVPPAVVPLVVTAQFMSIAAFQAGARAEGVAEGIEKTVSADSKKAARGHLHSTFKDAWWEKTTTGFSQDRFRADCRSAKVVIISRETHNDR